MSASASSPSAAPPADPNNWITNPPSTFVAIHNTSRDELNGALGLAVQYRAQEQRYIVVLCKSPRAEPKSFKADHLRKTTMMEQVRAQYELLTNDPTMQRQLQQGLQQIKLVTGLDVKYLVGLVMAALLMSAWLLGLRKTLLLASFIGMLALLLVPSYVSTKSVKGMLQAAPQRLRVMLRESNLPMANTIVSNNLYLALLVGFVLAFFVSGMLPQATATTAAASATGSSSSSISSWFSSAPSSSAPSAALYSALDVERFYKLGFDDATEQKAFGTSLPAAAATTETVARTKPSGPHRVTTDEFGNADDDISTGPYDTMPIPNNNKASKAASLFSISNAMCTFAIVRTVNELGRDNGVNGALDLRRLWANLQVQPVWRLGLLGLSVYRLASAVVGSLM